MKEGGEEGGKKHRDHYEEGSKVGDNRKEEEAEEAELLKEQRD